MDYFFFNSIEGFVHTGKRTEWSPIQSVIILVTIKSDDREAGV